MYVCVFVCVCVCVCVCVFYSCISGCLGCYNILTTIYRVTMNTDNYPEGGFLDHMVVLCVIFWKTSILFSTVAVLLCITTNSIQGLQFLHIIANTCCHLFVFSFFFDDGHPDRHEWHLTVVSTCLFLQIKWNVSDFKYFFFLYLLVICYVFSGEMSIQVLSPFQLSY